MAANVRLESHKDEFLEALKWRREVALEIIGQTAERAAMQLAPVDTGRLRASISHIVDDNMVAIGTNVEYAPYQELGTYRMSAANGGRGYLRPAITDNIEAYRRIIQNVLGGN